MTVIFARGTTETGNVDTLTGPPFFTALAQFVGASNLAVQGVDYPADIPGFLAGGDATGSMTMAQLVTQAMMQCPNTKVVISGYRYGYLYVSSM
jgi:cutinase